MSLSTLDGIRLIDRDVCFGTTHREILRNVELLVDRFGVLLNAGYQ